MFPLTPSGAVSILNGIQKHVLEAGWNAASYIRGSIRERRRKDGGKLSWQCTPSLPLHSCIGCTAGMNRDWGGMGPAAISLLCSSLCHLLPRSGGFHTLFAITPQILGFSHSLQGLFYFLLKPQCFPALQTRRFQHSAELVVSVFPVKRKLRGCKEISQLFTLLFLCTAHLPGVIPVSWAKSCPQCREQPQSS